MLGQERGRSVFASSAPAWDGCPASRMAAPGSAAGPPQSPGAYSLQLLMYCAVPPQRVLLCLKTRGHKLLHAQSPSDAFMLCRGRRRTVYASLYCCTGHQGAANRLQCLQLLLRWASTWFPTAAMSSLGSLMLQWPRPSGLPWRAHRSLRLPSFTWRICPPSARPSRLRALL